MAGLRSKSIGERQAHCETAAVCKRPRLVRCCISLLRSRQHVAHRLGVPLPTARRADAACVESIRYLMKRGRTGALYASARNDAAAVSASGGSRPVERMDGCLHSTTSTCEVCRWLSPRITQPSEASIATVDQ